MQRWLSRGAGTARVGLVALFVLFGLVGGACTVNSDPSDGIVMQSSPPDASVEEAVWEERHPVGEDWTDGPPLDLNQAYRAQVDWAREATGIGEDVEAPPLVRFVPLDEWPSVQVECMDSFGFVMRESQGGIVLAQEVPDDQGPAQRLALFKCDVMYPPDPYTNQILPRVRAEMQYHFQVETVAPCLRRLGVDVPEAPTLETWLGQFYASGEVWLPFNYVYEPGRELEAIDEYYAQCPANSPDLYPELN